MKVNELMQHLSHIPEEQRDKEIEVSEKGITIDKKPWDSNFERAAEARDEESGGEGSSR